MPALTRIKHVSVAILVISVLSFGMSGLSFADQHALPPIIVIVETDQELYAPGNTVIVTVTIKDPKEGVPGTLRILDANGNLIGIDQFIPNSSGIYSKEFMADGPLWKVAGDYKILINYGGQKAETTFQFTGGSGVVAPPPPPPVEPEPVEPEPVEPEPVEPEPVEPEPVEPEPVEPEPVEPEPSNGCLIATATFGSELASQVQQLRELRDNTLLQTNSGSAFMTGFNQIYYYFSPTIADWERENPTFKEVVKITLTPLITSLSLLNYVDMDSEQEVLGYGIGMILLNIGMYFVAPALIIFKLTNRKHST